MQSSLTEERTETQETSAFPRRDFFLLPLVSLLTILLLAGVAEGVTRLIWVEQPDDACQYWDKLGFRHKAFCASSMKNPEGPWVRYEYNACGYRGKESCGPKSPDVTRFAILGTSIAFGLYVPQDDLFYVRATPGLKNVLKRPVEFENLGMLGPDLGLQDKMIDEVAGLHPDGVFFIIVPFDLKRLDEKPLWVLQKQEIQKHWFPSLSDLAYLGRSSRAFFVAQHYLLSERDFAVRAFRMKSDPDDAAHVPPTPLSEKRFERLERLVRSLSDGFQRRGIPLYVIPLPSRLQAAIMHAKCRYAGRGSAGLLPPCRRYRAQDRREVHRHDSRVKARGRTRACVLPG